ncbi:thioredoxin family protein [Aestuariirhabdus litorea]
MEIKVLGSGCAKCEKTVESISRIARELGVDASVVKVTDLQQIVALGVMSTPGVVVDGTLVHSGSIPHRDEIERWLSG